MSDKASLRPWGMVPVDLMLDRRVTLNMVKVYVALASFQGNHETCWPSREMIAERSGLKLYAVSAASEELEEIGWIRKIRRSNHRQTNVYKVLTTFEKNDYLESRSESDVGESPISERVQHPDVGESPTSLLYENNKEKNKSKTVKSEEAHRMVKGVSEKSIAGILVDEDIDPKAPVELDRFVEMNLVDYARVCSEFGRDRVNSTIESISDWQRSKKGRKAFTDYAATVRTWIRRDGGKKRESSRQKCPNCGVDAFDGSYCYYCGHSGVSSRATGKNGLTFLADD